MCRFKLLKTRLTSAAGTFALLGLTTLLQPTQNALAQVPPGCINGFQAAGVGVTPTIAHVFDTITISSLGFGGAAGTSCELTNGQSFLMYPNGVTVQMYQSNFVQTSAGEILTCQPTTNQTTAGCTPVTLTYVVQPGDIDIPLSFTTPRGFSSGSVPGSPGKVKFLAVSDGFLVGSGGSQTGGGQGNTAVQIVTPGISVTKQCVTNCAPYSSPYGQPIMFTGFVSNTGDDTLFGVTVTDNPLTTIGFAATTSSGRTFDIR